MKMIPTTADRDTGGFFEAAAQGRLVYRACSDCSRAMHPPTPHCPHCGSANTFWQTAQGTGRLYAWTTVTHQVHPDYPVPYTVVLVELDDTPEVRLMGRIDGAPELQFGMPMEVWFETLAAEVVLPQWRPASR
jgi:uncharacterized protein